MSAVMQSYNPTPEGYLSLEKAVEETGYSDGSLRRFV
jgi:hypothetical protein